MARKKKEKITVDLDLPKDDTTLTKLYAILAVSIFIGLGCFGFWITILILQQHLMGNHFS